MSRDPHNKVDHFGAKQYTTIKLRCVALLYVHNNTEQSAGNLSIQQQLLLQNTIT